MSRLEIGVVNKAFDETRKKSIVVGEGKPSS
jgi:hypothetical protein